MQSLIKCDNCGTEFLKKTNGIKPNTNYFHNRHCGVLFHRRKTKGNRYFKKKVVKLGKSYIDYLKGAKGWVYEIALKEQKQIEKNTSSHNKKDLD